METNLTFENISTHGTKRLPASGVEQWDTEGVLHLPGLIPGALLDAYVAERKLLLGGTSKWRSGWHGATPYLQVKSMRDLALYRGLTSAIRPLIGGDEPGLHLCLTGFQSTERAWHMDRYLNPEPVGERYIAAWIALEDVHEDAGPFQYVPGSHRWPVIERRKVWDQMKRMGQNPNTPTWPSDSQGWVGQCCEAEIAARNALIKPFLGKRGDVLLWHASLVHRGSKPLDPALERRALICHYSSVKAREDMPHQKLAENGSHYFDFPHNTEPEESTHVSKSVV